MKTTISILTLLMFSTLFVGCSKGNPPIDISKDIKTDVKQESSNSSKTNGTISNFRRDYYDNLGYRDIQGFYYGDYDDRGYFYNNRYFEYNDQYNYNDRYRRRGYFSRDRVHRRVYHPQHIEELSIGAGTYNNMSYRNHSDNTK